MRLIGLAVVLTVGLILERLAVEPQTMGKVPRIGRLSNMAPPPPPSQPTRRVLQGFMSWATWKARMSSSSTAGRKGASTGFPPSLRNSLRLRVDVMMVAGVQG